MTFFSFDPHLLTHQQALAADRDAALNHPHILTIYEVGEVESGNHIAMEFIAGETLRARIARDRDVAKTLDL